MAQHRTELPAFSHPGGRRRRIGRGRFWSCWPSLGALEARTLLAGPVDVYAAAYLLSLDTPVTHAISPAAAIFYRISSDVAGQLTVMLHASEFKARLSLVDENGLPLVQSDGTASRSGDAQLDVNVAQGDNFLEVQSLSGQGLTSSPLT